LSAAEQAEAESELDLLRQSLVERKRKEAVTDALIEELCGESKPTLRVYNKMDKKAEGDFIPAGVIEISARTGEGIGELISALEEEVRGGRQRTTFVFPSYAAGKVSALYAFAEIEDTVYNDDGSITVTAYCEAKEVGRLSEYIVK